MKFKITGEIEANNEEEARFEATINAGQDILFFEEIDEKTNNEFTTLHNTNITR